MGGLLAVRTRAPVKFPLTVGEHVITPPKRLMLVVALAAVVVTAGCVSGPLSDDEEQQLTDRVQTELSDVDSYEATVTSVTTVDGESTTVQQHVEADIDAGKTFVKTLAPDERRGDKLVSNGSTMWRFDASENAVTSFDSSSMVGALGNVSELFDDAADTYNITVNGTETVGGTGTYVAELTPEGDTGTMTVWLNTSSFFPVQVQQSFSVDNTTYETTMTYDNVTLNPGFDAERFEYEPPADATVETVELPDTEQFDSAAALREGTNRSVASPDLPDDFSFDKGSVITEDGDESVSLAYVNETASVRISQRPVGDHGLDGETITVAGRNATLSSFGDTVFVTWDCDDTRYTVGTTVSESFARSVVASIDC